MFRFDGNGTFQLFNDGKLVETGTYSVVRYTKGEILFKVKYPSSRREFTGTYDVLNPRFKMANGANPKLDLTYDK